MASAGVRRGAFYLAALSAIIPAALKWKVEKARILLVVMILIPGAVILLGSRVLTPDTRRSLSAWIGGGMSGITAAAVGILLLAVIVTVSYLTSVKIFLKKNFNQGRAGMNQEQEKRLGTLPAGKLLFQMALPAIAAQIINVLYNIVDRMYIGHIPDIGDKALTGVGVCMPLIMAISAFAALASMGSAPRASIMMGKGDEDAAEEIMNNSFIMLLIIGVILTVVFLIFGRPILMMFGASENTIGYAIDYMRIYACGTLFVQLALGMNAFITAQGFAKTSMLTVLIGAVLNIILDPVFIFVFGME